jgi:peroxiredoxin Q/BCP
MHHSRRLRFAGALAVAVLIAFALVIPAQALQVGEKAPDFELPGSQGKNVKLSELTAKGPVLIYTFIAAFTGT